MKIKMFPVERMTISGFAKKHGLIMEVHEREGDMIKKCGEGIRFYAEFSRSEIKDGPILIGTFGDGRTPSEAIKNYATEISGKLLVINAYNKKERREIYVPILSAIEPKDIK